MDKLYQAFAFAALLAYWVVVVGVTLRVVFKRRAVGVSLAWLLVIYILPIVGVVFYFLFGELNLGKKRAARAKKMFEPYESWFNRLHDCPAHQPQHISSHLTPIHDLCLNRSHIPALCGDTLSLQNSPHGILRSIVDDITNAQHFVHLEFYIWHPGGLADSVGTALIKAAKRGVEVKVQLDSAGSMRFFKSHWPDMLRKAGVELIEGLAVSPFRMFFRRLDLRQHRKIVIIDNDIAYTGSMNLVDPKHFKQSAGVGEWVDVMVRITGPTAAVLDTIHSWDWEVETGNRNITQLPFCTIDNSEEILSSVQVIPSGPGMPEDIIQQTLITAFNQAKKSVRITTPYFVPSEHLLQTIKMTAYRGIKVDLIIPAKNDSIMVDWASRSFFSDLLEAGVNIYRFTGGLLHTKSVVIDEQFCLIGTVNLDMRSLWLNFELTLAIDDLEFTQELNWVLQDYINQSTLVCYKEWQKRSIMKRFVERVFYMFSPLL